MPSPQFSSFNFTAGPVALPNGVETVVATTKAVSSPSPGCTFGLFFFFLNATGAAATNVNPTVRRGSLTGAIVLGPTSVTIVANAANLHSYACTDAPAGEGASLVWVLTLTVVGGAAAGSANNIFANVIAAQ